MAVEQKRGCGYRKIGGTYLVGGGIAVPCDRLPIPLDVCPCCGQGIKQALGWTWIDVAKLVQGPHTKTEAITDDWQRTTYCPESPSCILCGSPEDMGRAGLMWVGERFYKTPQDFIREGVSMGFSKRIKAVPRGFKAGETYVLLAHPKTIDGKKPGVFYLWLPQHVEKIVLESQRDSEEVRDMEKRGITPVFVPDDDKDHQGRVYDKQEETE